MENSQLNTQKINPEQSDAVSQDLARVKSFVGKIKEAFRKTKNLSQKPNEVTVKNIINGNKVLISAFLIFMFLVVLLVLASLYKSLGVKYNQTPGPAQTPSNNQTKAPFTIENPSRYANDQKVLDIELKIYELEKLINSDNFKESQLNPLELDFNVK